MSYKILLVEDELDVRENIAEILNVSSYDVITASNGKEAVEKLSSNNPDLIISDITMPKMNGYKLLKYIQNSKRYSHLPFIFLTAKSSFNEVREGMRMGADDYLVKPFKAKDLLDIVSVRLKKADNLKQQLNELIENIALSVPHELRTPITPILGFSGIMVDDANTLTPKEIIEIGEVIKKSTLRLSSTIEKFIFFSNLQIELNNLNNSDSLLNGVTENLEEIVRNIIEIEKGKYTFNFKIFINIEECKLKIDDYYFTACLHELINNAFKFSECDSVIKIIGRPVDDLYELSVENSGQGLAKDHIHGIHVFSKKNNPTAPGSGLGLPIVKRIVEYFDGKFSMESEPGKFTKATINCIMK